MRSAARRLLPLLLRLRPLRLHPLQRPLHPRLLLPQPRRLLQRLRLREKCSMTTSSVLRRSWRNRRLARTVLEDPPRLRWAPSARANREFLLRG